MTGCTSWGPRQGQKPLTTVEQVRRLPERLGDRVPVRLRGTVTYADAQRDRFFFQDATGGLRSDTVRYDLVGVEAGSSVELMGTADSGGASPTGTAEEVHVIGPGVLPQPVHAR